MAESTSASQTECPVFPTHTEHQEPYSNRQLTEHHHTHWEGVQEGKRHGSHILVRADRVQRH